MDLFLAITQAIGVAAATAAVPGLGLAALVVLAHINVGVDFQGTGVSDLESPEATAAFLGLAALTLLTQLGPSFRVANLNVETLERARLAFAALVAAGAGAITMAGLNEPYLYGAAAGFLTGALVAPAVGMYISGVRSRLDSDQPGSPATVGDTDQSQPSDSDSTVSTKQKMSGPIAIMLVTVDLAVLAVVAVSVVSEPAGMFVLPLAVAFIVKHRSRNAQKFEGLRILR